MRSWRPAPACARPSAGLSALLEEGASEKEKQAIDPMPVTLASGNTRTFLEDGDEVIIRARARRDGSATIAFGELRNRVRPAQPS